MVYELAKAQYDAAVAGCEQERPQLESTIRTDMDQIITSKEHLASKIRGTALQGCSTGMWGCAHGCWGGCSRGAARLLAPLGGACPRWRCPRRLGMRWAVPPQAWQEWVQYSPGALCKNSWCCHERGSLLLEGFGNRGSSFCLEWV